MPTKCAPPNMWSAAVDKLEVVTRILRADVFPPSSSRLFINHVPFLPSSQSTRDFFPSSSTVLEQTISGIKMEFGCEHYQRTCSIRAPCCNEIFACRHCHNEAKNCVEIDPKERHEVPRHDVNQIICSQCGTEQDVQQNCSNCGVCFGKYFCEKCKLFDDDVSKRQFHCDGCGICRTGGEENFFHCDQCGCCYVNSLKGTHRCIEQAMHQNCPVCYEYMFDSLKDISVLSCGHTIHLDCLNEMRHHCRFSCPICSRSVCDMASVWRNLDQEIASTPMPEVYKNKMVWILCNDCGLRSNIHFHIVAHKCPGCNSYNTRQTQGGPEECLSG